MSEVVLAVVDPETEVTIGHLLVDEDDIHEAEAQAGSLGFELREVGA